MSTGIVMGLVLTCSVACFIAGLWLGHSIGAEDRRDDPWNRSRRNIEQLARERHRRELRESKEQRS